MSNSFDFFDQIYCIHLPKEKERKNLIDIEFQKLNVIDKVTFIHADPPSADFQISNMKRSPRGEFGCNMSQIKAVVHSISLNAKTPLFLEDDVVFDKQANKILNQAVDQLPSDWDILYLGGHPRGPAQKVSSSLAKVSRFSFSVSRPLPRSTLLTFFDEWTNRVSKPTAPYDFILGNFAEKCNAYCVYPIICKQRPGRSEIAGEYEDKSNLIDSRWKRWLK